MVEIVIPKIELIAIDKLKVDGKNPNKMTPGQKKALKANMKRFGFIVAIITNKHLLIADGQTRLEIAKELGMKKVPVIRLNVEEVDRRMLRQVLNKLKGEHDSELDAAEFKFLLEQNAMKDFDELIGDSDKKLVQFMASVEKNQDGEDNLDIESSLEAPKYPVKLGDVWELGDHRLVCGDATDKQYVSKLLSETKSSMVFTDPPYNMAYGSSKHPTWGKKWNANQKSVIANDELPPEEWLKFVDSWMQNILDSTNGAIYICMSCKEWANVMHSFEKLGGHWSSTVIWVKNSLVLSRKDYHTQFEPLLVGNDTDEEGEPIIYGWPEGEKRTWLGGRKQSDIWRIERRTVNDLHPIMKPVELVKRAVSNSSKPGDTVLDLFGGSGSTLIACEYLERKCLMMELEPRYCSVILERWEKLTNKKAKKVS